MKKPSNWYDMTNEEKRAWQRQADEFDELESEREEAIVRAERTAANARTKESELRMERDNAQDNYDCVYDELQDARAALAWREQFIGQKGLAEEFASWMRERAESKGGAA